MSHVLARWFKTVPRRDLSMRVSRAFLACAVGALAWSSLSAEEPVAGGVAEPRVGSPSPFSPPYGEDLDTPAADGIDAEDDDILGMDLEELARVDVVVPSMDQTVETVSRRETTVARTPSAVFVITNDMIRRSGATTIADALRIVPGMDVAQVSSNDWAVSCRGFNEVFANDLLVQIDGRPTYTPMFGGTYWDSLDTLLEDIERIEVIRGPGASVWGSNAVNGVVNIVTKDSKDTKGAYVKAGGGTHEKDFAAVRHGGELKKVKGLTYRFFGKYADRGDNYSSTFDPFDRWAYGRGGFRVDWDVDQCGTDQLMVLGDYYAGWEGQAYLMPGGGYMNARPDFTGGDLSARWLHRISEDSDLQFQYSYTAVDRGQLEQVHDFEFQHRIKPLRGHSVTWGLNYRAMRVWSTSLPTAEMVPPNPRNYLHGFFVQDEMTIVEDRLLFLAGIKGENNCFTGMEWQPTGRIVFMPSERTSIWGAVSRAVRIPTFVEATGGFIIATVPAFGPYPPQPCVIMGNPNLQSEKLMAYEIGVRSQPTDSFYWDLALFYNVYDQLATYDIVHPTPPMVVMTGNSMYGETYGMEFSARWQPTKDWWLTGYYAFLQMNLHITPGVTAPGNEFDEGNSPQNQVQLWSSWNVTEKVQFDLIGRYVDALVAMDVPDYITLDARLAWRPRRDLELTVVGRNLLDNHYPQFGQTVFSSAPTQVRREVYGQVEWRY